MGRSPRRTPRGREKHPRQRDDTGILRIDFPGYSSGSFEEISWKELFEKLDREKLALVYQHTTARERKSNFNKIVSCETVTGAARSRSGAGKSGGRAISETGRKRTRTATKNAAQNSGRRQGEHEQAFDHRQTSARIDRAKSGQMRFGKPVRLYHRLYGMVYDQAKNEKSLLFRVRAEDSPMRAPRFATTRMVRPLYRTSPTDRGGFSTSASWRGHDAGG